MDEITLRARMLLGEEALERLRCSHVAVFGIGGVGSWCAEALCRSGVGELTLVDRDKVSQSNRNRQLCALGSTVGLPKAEVMAARLLDINPACRVHPILGHYEAAERERFLAHYDYVVDCIDLVSCKLDLIPQAFCAWTTSPKPTAAPWPGSCARSCAPGGWSTTRWSSAPRSP